MTKTEALEKSLAMWRWLEANPNKGKEHYLMKCQYPTHHILHDCFLCEYVKSITPQSYLYDDAIDLDCELCPVKWIDKKGNKIKTDLDNLPCVSNDTIYDEWEYGLEAESFENSKKYAGMIADLIENELNKLIN